MTTTAPFGPDQETAIARSGVYALLAGSLAYPTTAVRADLHRAVVPLVASTRTGDAALDRLLAGVVAAQQAPLSELQAAHSLQFTHIESQDCPPYETAFFSRDIFRQTQVMADVAGFYRAHGLRVGGTERERPDHIATELEFMGFMAHKEALALSDLGPDELDECRTTQAHFLRDHLGRWGHAFGRRVQAAGGHPLFVAVGALLPAWLDWDQARAGVEPAALLDEPEPLPPPDDGSCGLEGDPVREAPVRIRDGRR